MEVNLYDQMAEILDEIKEDVHDCAEKATEKAGKETAKILRSSSPTKSGAYKKGWTSMKTNEANVRYGATVVVYNKKMPGLTQLLERGHATVNKRGVWGRTPAYVHIKPAADQGADIFVEEATRLIESKLGR